MADHEAGSTDRLKVRLNLKAAACAVLLVLLLVLAPPLINANRLSRRIAGTMSESLGRPVHLDKVSLHLLPVPGFTMENLVVSEDPAFGYEPVIRANRVEASIRVSSLWRRQVEFSSVRFVTDSNGSAPSMNLVRRADGRWNLENILIHAANVSTAPTAQTKAGPAPRFPYIEATGARINIKIGDEKKPFALTDADFALWLPSPQQWRVRLQGKPTRTDTSVFDTGVFNMEATLARAPRLKDVPVELTAEWKRVPLGQASMVVSGSDMGWRGDLDLRTSLHGTIGDSAVTTTLRLTHVRRSDFIPQQTIDLTVECSGHVLGPIGMLREPACTMPVGEESGATRPQPIIAATADNLNLTNLQGNSIHVGMAGVPESWLLSWARLFSQRMPPQLNWTGTVSGSATVDLASAGDAGFSWTGSFVGSPAAASLPSTAAVRGESASTDSRASDLEITAAAKTLVLTPMNVAPAGDAPLMLGATADPEQFRLSLSGDATAEEISNLADRLPPLADGLQQALPTPAVADAGLVHVDVVCTRVWGAPQTCTSLRPAAPASNLSTLAKPRPRRHQRP